MPKASTVIPHMESIVGRLDSTPQGVAMWVEFMKTIMLNNDRGSDQWEFIPLTGLQEADTELGIVMGTDGEATGVDISDCLLYGILVRNIGSQATEDGIVGITASKGSFALSAIAIDLDVSTLNTGYAFVTYKTSDGTTPEYATWVDPKGLSIAESGGEIYAFCDGNEGTQPVASTVNIWVLLKIVAHD